MNRRDYIQSQRYKRLCNIETECNQGGQRCTTGMIDIRLYRTLERTGYMPILLQTPRSTKKPHSKQQ